jgi:CBS domain-containing protein
MYTIEDEGHSRFIPVDEDCTLLDVMLLLGKYRLRRAPVIRGDLVSGKVVNVITQSELVRRIVQALDGFKALAEKSLMAVNLVKPEVLYTVTPESPVREAFQLMSAKVDVWDPHAIPLGQSNMGDTHSSHSPLDVVCRM